MRHMKLLGLIALLGACSTEPTAVRSATSAARFDHSASGAATRVVVSPESMNGWYFWNDKNDTFAGSPGELVSGPATPPLGVGSVRLGPLTDNGETGSGHAAIATDAYLGTRLADITSLSYSTYQPGPTLAIALQFDIRYHTSDTHYDGRLVFEPYQNLTGSVPSGWQTWSPLAGKWWASKPLANGNVCAQATPCSWSDIVAMFPEAIIAGRFLLKAGSHWAGFDGNADAVSIGVNGSTTVFDFEPFVVAESKDQCKSGGWATLRRADGSGFLNQGDCIQYTNTGK
jgi:hypothetical protein